MRTIPVATTLAFLGLLGACADRKAMPAAQDPHAGHAAPATTPSTPPAAMPAPAQGLPEGYTQVAIGEERVQKFGVRTEVVRRDELVRVVRTVGVVATDETRESHVHTKWEGWIEEFFVNYVGQQVEEGAPLFSVYSPELLTAQQELLIAARRSAAAADRAQDREAATALLEAARTKLRLWDVPADTIAAIEAKGELQRVITVRAPRAGTVLAKMALPGMFVEPAMDLYTIADLSTVWVIGDLYEFEAPFVKAGMEATFAPIGAIGEAEHLTAKVAFVHPTVEPMARTVKVRLEVLNPDGHLRPGAYGTVRLRIPLGAAVLVPTDAVIFAGDRRLVFVAKGEGRFEPRELRLGAQGEGKLQVLEGLSEGESIVTRAQFLLDSESRLRAAVAQGARAGHAGH